MTIIINRYSPQLILQEEDVPVIGPKYDQEEKKVEHLSQKENNQELDKEISEKNSQENSQKEEKEDPPAEAKKEEEKAAQPKFRRTLFGEILSESPKKKEMETPTKSLFANYVFKTPPNISVEKISEEGKEVENEIIEEEDISPIIENKSESSIATSLNDSEA